MQKELIDDKLSLGQTSAGQELEAELNRMKVDNEIKLKKLEQEYKKTLEEKDREWQADIAR